MSRSSIYKYYNSLAKTYDENRFENSYGKYIDQQERYFLKSFLHDKNYSTLLDLGCGTGRLMNFATHGTDFSGEMIKIAQKKHSDKIFEIGDISKIPFDIKFDCIFCFHVIMHQTKEETLKFLDECFSKLNQNGVLIFDYPTRTRKKSISPQESWHANNAFTENEIFELVKNNWKIKKQSGILFFPIQRFPKKMRTVFLGLDTFLCKTFLKKWASYNIIILEKNEKTRSKTPSQFLKTANQTLAETF